MKLFSFAQEVKMLTFALYNVLFAQHIGIVYRLSHFGELGLSTPFKGKYVLGIVVSLQEDLQCSITKCSSLCDFLHTE